MSILPRILSGNIDRYKLLLVNDSSGDRCAYSLFHMKWNSTTNLPRKTYCLADTQHTNTLVILYITYIFIFKTFEGVFPFILILSQFHSMCIVCSVVRVTPRQTVFIQCFAAQLNTHTCIMNEATRRYIKFSI